MIDGQSSTITPDQLCIGLYVTLDVGWTEHPFLFRSFKIRNTGQLVALKALGLTKLNYLPSKSDAQPLPPGAAAPATTPAQVEQAMKELWKEKHERIAQRSTFRNAVNQSEKHYLRTTESAKQIPDLPPEAVDIIHHHHESADGSGYPEHQSGEAIAGLTRIVAIE